MERTIPTVSDEQVCLAFLAVSARDYRWPAAIEHLILVSSAGDQVCLDAVIRATEEGLIDKLGKLTRKGEEIVISKGRSVFHFPSPHQQRELNL